MEEVDRVVVEKTWLAERVSPNAGERLRTVLVRSAEVSRRLTELAESVSRDPGDDYHIAHALLAQVDYPITGDKDLLELGEVEGVRIVDPVTFLAVLRTESDSG
jgi:predicted nucleic acid-binding protein